MTRISVGGFWFDLDAAERFEESQTHDGRNFISDATGSQWDHETLYRTKKGRWVLNESSQWQGSQDKYSEVSASDASAWLIAQGHSKIADKYFPKLVSETEI